MVLGASVHLGPAVVHGITEGPVNDSLDTVIGAACEPGSVMSSLQITLLLQVLGAGCQPVSGG